MKMNDQRVRALPHLENGQRDYADDAVPGLAVRVGKSTKTFRLVIGTGRDRKRFTLGQYDPPHFTLAMAREKARDIIAAERVSKTETPRTTFSEAFELYDRLHVSTLARGTARDIRRVVGRRFSTKLGKLPLSEITRRDLAPILDDMTDAPAAMGAAFRHIRAFLRWCIGRGYIETSPTDRMPIPKREEPRSRVLSSEELTEIWKALPDDDYGRIIKLCILSGQRKGQWAGIRREYISDDLATWPKQAMKMEKPHTLPLTPAMKVILPDRIGYLFPTAGGVPFNNWAACKRRLDASSGVSNWRVHDLRRTWATIAADELDIQPHIIESVLAHSIGNQVARTYNRARYLEPMRKALLAFEEWLHLQLSKPEGSHERRQLR